MRWLVALLVLVLTLYGVAALTDGEVAALEDLSQEWNHFGGLWPVEGIRTACNPPFWFGLSCSGGDDPHVTHLYAPGPFSILYRIRFTVSGLVLLPSSLTLIFLKSSNISGPPDQLRGRLPDSIGQLSWLETLYVLSFECWNCIALPLPIKYMC